MSVRVEAGDCRQIIPTLGVTVDAVVCDPPYDLVAMTKRFGKGHVAAKSPDHQRFAKGFMGREWDGTGVAFDPETWRIVGSVLRPGGIILAFGAPRTHHRLASAIEDAGFVIQDCLMWLFATGFPKRRDMLKPAYEPIVMAYKPGGARTLQIDECRIPTKGEDRAARYNGKPSLGGNGHVPLVGRMSQVWNALEGRWPANICHDGSENVVAGFPDTKGDVARTMRIAAHKSVAKGSDRARVWVREEDNGGSAARFFFSAKAGKDDRYGSRHPTVKPIELMKWLVALVTPPDGLVLDPFAGSGTTGAAALATGRNCILIERETEYLGDIKERLAFYEGEGRHSMVSKARRNTTPRGDAPLLDQPYDEAADSLASYHEAVRVVGEQVKNGAPVPPFFLATDRCQTAQVTKSNTDESKSLILNRDGPA